MICLSTKQSLQAEGRALTLSDFGCFVLVPAGFAGQDGTPGAVQ